MSKFIKVSQNNQPEKQSDNLIAAITKNTPKITIEDVTAELYRISRSNVTEETKNKMALEYLQKVNASLSSLQGLMKSSPEISAALSKKGVKL
jgi:predicted nucleic acid-binding protein